MLQQNLMSAADLGISEAWYVGLIKVLGLLERGELTHVKTSDETWVKIRGPLPPMMFNMNYWDVEAASYKDHRDCGTVHCIGGWIEKLVGRRLSHTWPDELGNLFYPADRGIASDTMSSVREFYQSITVAQAAHATRNYLTHGSPNWAAVLTKQQKLKHGYTPAK